MRIVSFEHNLASGVIARVRFKKGRGRILSFVVQLECLIEGRWYPIVRYDTAHGYAHRDVLKPDGKKEKQSVPVQDFNAALTYAQRDIKDHWRRYLAQYKRWLR